MCRWLGRRVRRADRLRTVAARRRAVCGARAPRGAPALAVPEGPEGRRAGAGARARKGHAEVPRQQGTIVPALLPWHRLPGVRKREGGQGPELRDAVRAVLSAERHASSRAETENAPCTIRDGRASPWVAACPGRPRSWRGPPFPRSPRRRRLDCIFKGAQAHARVQSADPSTVFFPDPSIHFSFTMPAIIGKPGTPLRFAPRRPPCAASRSISRHALSSRPRRPREKYRDPHLAIAHHGQPLSRLALRLAARRRLIPALLATRGEALRSPAGARFFAGRSLAHSPPHPRPSPPQPPSLPLRRSSTVTSRPSRLPTTAESACPAGGGANPNQPPCEVVWVPSGEQRGVECGRGRCTRRESRCPTYAIRPARRLRCRALRSPPSGGHCANVILLSSSPPRAWPIFVIARASALGACSERALSPSPSPLSPLPPSLPFRPSITPPYT